MRTLITTKSNKKMSVTGCVGFKDTGISCLEDGFLSLRTRRICMKASQHPEL